MVEGRHFAASTSLRGKGAVVSLMPTNAQPEEVGDCSIAVIWVSTVRPFEVVTRPLGEGASHSLLGTQGPDGPEQHLPGRIFLPGLSPDVLHQFR